MKKLLNAQAFALSLALAALIGLIEPTPTDAEIKTIEASGMYIMGDGPAENFSIARERARENAKRAAVEQAGVYVESISEMHMSELTRDEIRTVSSNVLQIQSSEVSVEVGEGNSLIFRCHIVALVDSERATDQLTRDGAELDDAVRRNKELEARLSGVNAELISIKQQYASARSEAEKDLIGARLKRNEQKFEADRLTEQGNELMRNRNFDAAIRSYNEALNFDPNDALIAYRLGNAHRELGNYAQAVTCYREALSLDAAYADAYNNLGLAYSNLEDYVRAIKSFTRALDNSPDRSSRSFAELHNNRGTCYQLLGRFDEAIEDYARALEIDPGYSEPRVNLERLKAWLND